MWKAIAAGLMCLGFVTLGIGASRAQEDVIEREDADLIVIEGKPEGEPVPATPAEGAGLSNDRGGERTVEIVTEDGKVERDLRDGAVRRLRTAIPAKTPVPVVDPGTREALEKLLDDLKGEYNHLLAVEGKKVESQKKLPSIEALEQLLNPGQRWTVTAQQAPQWGAVHSRVVRVDENSRAGQEIKKLHARLAELRDQSAKNQDAEAHVKIQQEIAELHKKLAELQGQGSGAAAADSSVQWAYGSPEAASLMRKSQALLQAGHQLQQAGLHEQSWALARQAETLRAEAEKIRDQTRSYRQVFRGVIAGPPVAGPPVDLQRAICELQEQIQQLRKEIGELRELLQKSRQ